MKKIISICFAVLMTLSLASCSNDDVVYTPASSAPSESGYQRPFKTGTNAVSSGSDDGDTVSEKAEHTYWDDEPLFIFGLEKVPVPDYLKFRETFSSEDAINIAWTGDNVSASATKLATEVFKALTDKDITIYEYKNAVKGEPISSVDKAADILTDDNALYKMVYRYNDTEYYMSISALPGSGSESKYKFVYMTVTMYFDNTNAE